MQITTTRMPTAQPASLSNKAATTVTESAPKAEDSFTFQSDSEGNWLSDYVEKRPYRAAATAFSLGVAIPAALGAEYGLGFQGMGYVMSAAAIGSMLVGAGEMATAITETGSAERGRMALRGVADMTAGITAAFISPGGTPAVAAAIVTSTAIATLV